MPERLDSLGMWEATAALPEQLAAAMAAPALDLDALASRPISDVVAIGMGGSGIAGDLLAAFAAPQMAVPVTVVKSYDLPAFVGADTLVVAVSCSGDTDETVAATTAALQAGAAVVGVTAGGRLGSLVAGAGFPVLDVPADLPQPRTGIAAMSVPPLVLLERLGLLEGVEPSLRAAGDQLARRRDQLIGAQSPARHVARRIGRTSPLIHGSSGLGEVAAVRWKTQVNENAKSPAFSAVQPELCHNEIAGWGVNGDVTRQTLTLVTLRHEGEDERLVARYALVEELVLEIVADVIEIRAEGQGSLAQFFDLVLFGDFVSLHLAEQQGVDPGPVPVLAEIKAALRPET